MRRIAFGLLVALVLACPLVAQTGLDVSFTVAPAKLELLKDALEARIAMPPLPEGYTAPVVDAAFMHQWIVQQCRGAIDAKITQFEREEVRQGGSLDISTLTRAQRLQVKALIQSFQK